MTRLAFTEHDLRLDDCENGIYVEQHGRRYLARKWRLTEQVKEIVWLGVANGLTCLWQERHPGGPTSHHISFSFSHNRASWVFCIGDGAGAPDVRKITVSKKIKGMFRESGIDAFWECRRQKFLDPSG